MTASLDTYQLWMRIERIARRCSFVVIPVCVVVRLRSGCLFGHAKSSERVRVIANGNVAGLSIQRLRDGAFVPDMQFVTTGRHVGDGDCPARVGDAVIGRLEGDHHRAHLGMNIAKNITDALAIEDYGAAATRFVKAQVETLSVKKRKDVVEKRIFVGKATECHLHYHQMGIEALFLHQLLPGSAVCRGPARRGHQYA